MPKLRNGNMVCPWLSGRASNREKRFVQLGSSLLLSRTFQSLGSGAQLLYLCMAMESKGHRDFVFTQSAADQYGISRSSFWRHVGELEAGGFVKISSGKHLRRPNRYQFCESWKQSSSHAAGREEMGK